MISSPAREGVTRMLIDWSGGDHEAPAPALRSFAMDPRQSQIVELRLQTKKSARCYFRYLVCANNAADLRCLPIIVHPNGASGVVQL